MRRTAGMTAKLRVAASLLHFSTMFSGPQKIVRQYRNSGMSNPLTDRDHQMDRAGAVRRTFRRLEESSIWKKIDMNRVFFAFSVMSCRMDVFQQRIG
jgi:hypothetical protein